MFIEGSVIQKCSHGVYEASDEEVLADRALFCQFCTPACMDFVLGGREISYAIADIRRQAGARTEKMRRLRAKRDILRKIPKVRRRKK